MATSEYWRTFHLDSVFLVRFDPSELLPQGSGRRGGLVPTSYHLFVGGGGTGHPRIIRIAGKSQTIHNWSDRASNYFVSGEDDIRPGSISGATVSYRRRNTFDISR